MAENPIEKQAKRLFKQAAAEKALFDSKFREAYRYTMPHRIRPGHERGAENKPDDDAELCTSVGSEVLGDFASDMNNTFTPRQNRWAEWRARDVPGLNRGQIKQFVTAIESAVFDEIARSNFYDVMPMAWKEAGISTCALTAPQVRSPGGPLFMQVVAIPELYILRGPFGEIDTRFRRWRISSDDIQKLWPDEDLPPKILRLSNAANPAKLMAIEGGWLDGDAWQCATLVDDTLIRGWRRESAPILVGRMNPDPGYSWGIGPALDALPDMRMLDELEYLKAKGVAFSVDPAGVYDDDGVLNLEAGLEPGRWYPKEPGSETSNINKNNQLDVAYFEVEELESRIRRKFFQDKPRQRGKTPPSASQFLEELQEATQRLSTPTAPLWSEFLSQIMSSFLWTLQKLGRLPEDAPLELIANLVPMNPLERAARQNDALTATRALEIIMGFSGQIGPMLIAPETWANINALLGAEKTVKLNDPEEVKRLLSQGLQAQQAIQGAQ